LSRSRGKKEEDEVGREQAGGCQQAREGVRSEKKRIGKKGRSGDAN